MKYLVAAREAPEKLIAALASEKLDARQRKAIAEALGGAPDELAGPALLKLLKDASPSVREGACYGLTSMNDDPKVRAWLERTIKTDVSPAVVHAAKKALQDD